MSWSLDHVQVAIPPGGENDARAFYGGVLGLVEVPKPPALAVRGGCWFVRDDFELHCGVEDPHVPARKAHPGIAVDDLDAIAASLEAAGAGVVWDEATIDGRRRFHVLDPFGNRLEFLTDA